MKPTDQNLPLMQRERAQLQSRVARLHQFLAATNSLLTAASEADPLLALQELACSLLHTDDVEIAVPTGLGQAPRGAAHYLECPVIIGGRPLGSLRVRRETVFDEDDAAIAACIGQITGAVFELSAMQSQIDEQRHRSTAYAGTFEQLLSFGHYLVGGAVNPEQTVRNLTSRVTAMVGGERASLLLLPFSEEGSPLLVLSSGATISGNRAAMVRDQGLAGLVLRELRPLIIDETDTDQRWLELSFREADTPTRCAMAVPLRWGGRVLGALTVTTTHTHLFGASHLNLLELIGCYLSLAIHSSRLSQQLIQINASLNQLACRISETAAAARAALARGEVAAADQALEQLMTLSDDLAGLMCLCQPGADNT